MLIGAHVSTAGGLAKAIERGKERGCETVQIFNQSPRQWKPTAYGNDDFAAFNEGRKDAGIGGVLIHAVYLINAASIDPELQTKSLASLVQSLAIGDAIGADGVVLHAGSAKGEPIPEAIARAGATVREALAQTESCKLLFEDTAGAGGTLGRDLDELAALVDAAGSCERVGICLDSCHMLASGFDIATPAALTSVLDAFDKEIGLDRLGGLHLNDSKFPLGSNKDRHANLGEGELGTQGCETFLSEPRFEGLPLALEVPGIEGDGPGAEDVALARKLRKQGLAARKRKSK